MLKMKTALLNGKIITAPEALEYRERTGKNGYIYTCPECNNPARVHKDNDGHFEHKNRISTCPLCHVPHG